MITLMIRGWFSTWVLPKSLWEMVPLELYFGFEGPGQKPPS